MNADEHLPAPELRQAIMNAAALPLIRRMAHEANLPLSFLGLHRVMGVDVEPFGAADGFWKVRLIVRHAHTATRKLWRVQALVPRQEGTGFCGFQMRGDARIEGDAWAAETAGWTGLYNTEGCADWD
jgi:hypothetical protein